MNNFNRLVRNVLLVIASLNFVSACVSTGEKPAAFRVEEISENWTMQSSEKLEDVSESSRRGFAFVFDQNRSAWGDMMLSTENPCTSMLRTMSVSNTKPTSSTSIGLATMATGWGGL